MRSARATDNGNRGTAKGHEARLAQPLELRLDGVRTELAAGPRL